MFCGMRTRSHARHPASTRALGLRPRGASSCLYVCAFASNLFDRHDHRTVRLRVVRSWACNIVRRHERHGHMRTCMDSRVRTTQRVTRATAVSPQEICPLQA